MPSDSIPSDQGLEHPLTVIEAPVIIVGAGPVGLLLALRLAQSRIRSIVLEKDASLNEAPRAIGYYGPVHKVFQEIGLYDRISREGMPSGGYVWRKLPVNENIVDINGSHTVKSLGPIIGRNTMSKPDHTGDYPIGHHSIQLAQADLARILIEEATMTGFSQVIWSHEVTKLEQDHQGVTIITKNPQKLSKTFRCQYLVGCDGAKSTVRKLLGIRYSGHSWPERFIATDILRVAPVVSEIPVHFVVDPTYWAVVTPLEPVEAGKKGLWRYSMAVPAQLGNDEKDVLPLSDEQVLQEDYVNSLLSRQIDGPVPAQFEVVQKSLYKMHQLVADTMHRGRCFLAGDSAHINNPIGGLGLCTGLLDADALHQVLEIAFSFPVWQPKTGCANNTDEPHISENPETSAPGIQLHVDLPSLFSRYSDERRRVFQNVIHPYSSANKLRLSAGDPDEVAREDWYLQALRRADPEELREIHKPLYDSWRTDIWKLLRSTMHKENDIIHT